MVESPVFTAVFPSYAHIDRMHLSVCSLHWAMETVISWSTWEIWACFTHHRVNIIACKLYCNISGNVSREKLIVIIAAVVECMVGWKLLLKLLSVIIEQWEKK